MWLFARFRLGLGILFFSQLGSSAIAQATSTQTTGSAVSVGATVLSVAQLSGLTQTFEQQQQSLAQSFRLVVQQGATSDQIQAWITQNASQLNAQQQLAQTISAGQPLQPIAYITDVDIPADASQTMEDFLEARANLFNARAQLHNQQLQSTGTVNEETVEATFEQQNAAALQTQIQRAQTLGQESDQQSMPVPPPLTMPAEASPRMQAFLTLHDQLMREQIQLYNQNVSASSAAKEAALEQWMQQNASRLQQLQTLAQNLSSTAN